MTDDRYPSLKGKCAMLRFDATLSEQINHAIAASGRSKTAECLVRLRHHLSLYPDFISQEVSDRDTITEK